tara:strand:- start:2609 stop:2920 length:312 start_codon:yes stop_codon:yes gene_type:complete
MHLVRTDLKISVRTKRPWRNNTAIEGIAALVWALMPTEDIKSIPPGWSDSWEIFNAVRGNRNNRMVNLEDERPEGCIGYAVVFGTPYINNRHRYKTKYYGIQH